MNPSAIIALGGRYTPMLHFICTKNDRANKTSMEMLTRCRTLEVLLQFCKSACNFFYAFSSYANKFSCRKHLDVSGSQQL